jgi:hypothetical protein
MSLPISCRYKIIREIGDGTCGNVFMAYNVETNEIVSARTDLLEHFAVVLYIRSKLSCFVLTRVYLLNSVCMSWWVRLFAHSTYFIEERLGDWADSCGMTCVDFLVFFTPSRLLLKKWRESSSNGKNALVCEKWRYFVLSVLNVSHMCSEDTVLPLGILNK